MWKTDRRWPWASLSTVATSCWGRRGSGWSLRHQAWRHQGMNGQIKKENEKARDGGPPSARSEAKTRKFPSINHSTIPCEKMEDCLCWGTTTKVGRRGNKAKAMAMWLKGIEDVVDGWKTSISQKEGGRPAVARPCCKNCCNSEQGLSLIELFMSENSMTL
jgi:hypothetical protein